MQKPARINRLSGAIARVLEEYGLILNPGFSATIRMNLLPEYE